MPVAPRAPLTFNAKLSLNEPRQTPVKQNPKVAFPIGPYNNFTGISSPF